MTAPFDTPFAALAAASCPPHDEMLVALEREFCAVDRERVGESLDDLARPLFGWVDAAPEEGVVALARTAWEALPEDGTEPPHWLLACALDARAATGPIRAALAVELGRRAGIRARAARLRGCWAVRLPGSGRDVAADVGADRLPHGPAGDLCAHQLAFAVLTGLSEAWRESGDVARAQRASGLRLLLPLGEELRSLVHADVRAIGRES